MWGDAEWTRRDNERVERERQHNIKLDNKAAAIRALLVQAEHDREIAQLIEMAKLIGPDGWHSRARTIADVECTRTRHDANDPVRVMQRSIRLRSADLALEYSINQARKAIALVRGWDA